MLTAVAGIVLGMGMPTTPAYIVMVSLLVPAVIKLGATTPAAHMFALHFAILSAITPPVALAIFAAAGLARTDLWATGLEAMRIAAPTYLVPFMFVYEPSLLMTGDVTTIVTSSVTAIIGVDVSAAGLMGYLRRGLFMVGAAAARRSGLAADQARLHYRCHRPGSACGRGIGAMAKSRAGRSPAKLRVWKIRFEMHFGHASCQWH